MVLFPHKDAVMLHLHRIFKINVFWLTLLVYGRAKLFGNCYQLDTFYAFLAPNQVQRDKIATACLSYPARESWVIRRNLPSQNVQPAKVRCNFHVWLHVPELCSHIYLASRVAQAPLPTLLFSKTCIEIFTNWETAVWLSRSHTFVVFLKKLQHKFKSKNHIILKVKTLDMQPYN